MLPFGRVSHTLANDAMGWQPGEVLAIEVDRSFGWRLQAAYGA